MASPASTPRSASAADCPLSYAGLTVYATVDVGVGFETNGAPFNAAFGPGDAYLISKANQPAPNGSFIFTPMTDELSAFGDRSHREPLVGRRRIRSRRRAISAVWRRSAATTRATVRMAGTRRRSAETSAPSRSTAWSAGQGRGVARQPSGKEIKPFLRRLLLIITYRPEFAPAWIGRPHVTALTLNRLTRFEIAEMVENVAVDKPLPESVKFDIVERAGGVPLFAEEITKAMLEATDEGAAPACAFAANVSPAPALPARLYASLARLDRLGAARDIVQMAALTHCSRA